MLPVFVAPVQCSSGLHLGTVVSLLHADILCRLQNSIGIPATLFQFWNATGVQAEKAASELGLPPNREGYSQAVTQRIAEHQEELAAWSIRPSQQFRDDQIDAVLLEDRLQRLASLGKATLQETESVLLVNRDSLSRSIASLPLGSHEKKRLLHCAEGFPTSHLLHKDRGYGVWLPNLKFSLDPKIIAAAMPDLLAPEGLLVMGHDVLERMLLLHLVTLPNSQSRLHRLLIHGLLVGEDGKKMSRHASNELKSRNCSVDPDVVRLSVLNRMAKNALSAKQLDDSQSVQMRYQYSQLLAVIPPGYASGVCTNDPRYVAAVNDMDFKSLFDWLRKSINHDLSGVLARKIVSGTATPNDVSRAQALMALIGSVFLPNAYST